MYFGKQWIFLREIDFFKIKYGQYFWINGKVIITQIPDEIT